MKIYEITEKAVKYMAQAGFPYSRIEKIEKNESEGLWIITIAVSIGANKKTLKIDDETGDIVGYE